MMVVCSLGWVFRESLSEEVAFEPKPNDLSLVSCFPEAATKKEGGRENSRTTLNGSEAYVVVEKMGYGDK